MKKFIILLTLLTLAAPVLAEPLTIIGQRMNMHATRPGDPSSPRQIIPTVRFRYTGAQPQKVRIGWQILNGNNAEVTRVEKTAWLYPGKTVSLNGPEYYDYSGAILKLRGYAVNLQGQVLVERSSAPTSQH